MNAIENNNSEFKVIELLFADCRDKNKTALMNDTFLTSKYLEYNQFFKSFIIVLIITYVQKRD